MSEERTVSNYGLSKHGKVYARAALSFALLAALWGPAASVSQADPLGVITCTGTVTSTFSPGIRLTPQTVSFSVDGHLTNCVSSSDPNLHLTGSFGASGTGTFSCAANITPFAQTIYWSNKGSSRITGTSIGPNLLGDGVYSSNGTVVSGDFVGSVYNSEGIITAPDPLECLPGIGDGVNFRSGNITITIAGM